MASVRVAASRGVIHAVYEGTMTMELVKEGQRQIEALIPTLASPVVLYDTLAMDPPQMSLALEMKAFDSRIAPLILRSATVVSNAATAFCAKVAFIFSREHRVFYNDRRAAIDWLQSAIHKDSERRQQA
ncbi:MAG: hypothetical protein ABI837_12725 [Acidobacteriota bacterium]